MRIVAYESDDRDDEKKCDSEKSAKATRIKFPTATSHLYKQQSIDTLTTLKTKAHDRKKSE